ncbi:hypothetical protein H6F88_12145 [Oculatella sp. FACHB-28]|uniref:hypothetical protein n=1 Tax=Leptolyngbya sp. FACHB-541 TaxID=2692810 RepID=UPI001689C52B|nr:hypothetical protein [Leptolyngbya sp. FACHB-541]MBD2000661.1 hypothetical protein [Leptolyngbya sp. FACHB-541]MBD2056753.1 hypothetical protein [Oculatella sp. FACHB-28]
MIRYSTKATILTGIEVITKSIASCSNFPEPLNRKGRKAKKTKKGKKLVSCRKASSLLKANAELKIISPLTASKLIQIGDLKTVL